MADENPQSNRQEFLKTLEEVFGEYEVLGSSIKFDKFSNRQIADFLAIAESQFSAYLNPGQDKKDNSYSRMIQKVELYKDAKAFRELKSKTFAEKEESLQETKPIPVLPSKDDKEQGNTKRKYLIARMIIAGLLLLSLVQFFSTELMKEGNSSDLYVYPIPEVNQVLLYVGRTNRYRFQRDAVIANSQVKGDNYLTRSDSLKIIKNLISGTKDAASDEREAMGSLNYRVTEEVSLFELANKTISVHPDTIFKMDEEAFLEALQFGANPKDITPFDAGLLAILPLIFDRNIAEELLIKKVNEIVEESQNKISHAVEAAIKREKEKSKSKSWFQFLFKLSI